MPYLNPYKSSGTWIRCNFHGHCSEHSTCGKVPLTEKTKKYNNINTACLAITDHNCITDLSEIRKEFPHIIFLEGFEYSSGPNFVVCNEKIPSVLHLPPKEILSSLKQALRFVCHPSPFANGQEYWSLTSLKEMNQYFDGIEIYNGHYGISRMRETGYTPDYRKTWDILLSDGYHIWGYANDDFHEDDDFNNAFNMVLVDAITPANIIKAAKNGSFYASTGLFLKKLIVSENTCFIELCEKAKGKLIGGRRVINEQESATFKFDLQKINEPYLRFEAQKDSRLLCLQPFFWLT